MALLLSPSATPSIGVPAGAGQPPVPWKTSGRGKREKRERKRNDRVMTGETTGWSNVNGFDRSMAKYFWFWSYVKTKLRQ